MHAIGLMDLLRIEALALLACGMAFVLRTVIARRRPAPAMGGAETVFLFDGPHLLDASASARTLLTQIGDGDGTPRDRVMAFLTRQFADAADQFDRLETLGRLRLHSRDLTCTADWRGGVTRIVLDGDSHGPTDILTQRVQADEVARLRHIVQTAPLPLWQEAADGEVIWANRAYCAVGGKAAETWPLPRLFPADAPRSRLSGPGDVPLWFALARSGTEGEVRAGFAWPVDQAVDAENALSDFRQTLTRTFADLPIGLAIFDHRRNLQMFNPALLDLTGLPADFLSARPTLFAVLDAMRDRSMIPEPKDYHGWRKRMVDLEEAATQGRYEETWSLPSGQTYRVVGRPYPGGAMAIMFEDISSEMTRTRRFRADLALGQAVIDAMEEAVAVFSPSGQLVISNARYADLWGEEVGTSLGEEAV
ncbi:PAS-domain containing protein, partial [Falsirhodobacter halotolerans]|uniref:PAS-domain containing protein n=1 Tax=Falsirhodobacter halotolerans TaxID=1146892 RepID=UPI001FD34623